MLDKPFHRNYRPVKKQFNSNYSDWAYITDKDYSINPNHYVRTFLLIQEDLKKIFEYIEPSEINFDTYSIRIHELLMRTCIEVEANFKAILKENTFTPRFGQNHRKAGQLREEKYWNINDFKIVNKSHHLDDYSIQFPIWKGSESHIKPFFEWKENQSLSWYKAYNDSKHDRFNNFEKANLKNLVSAFAGLCVLLSSQFRDVSFEPGPELLWACGSDSYYKGQFGIGEYLLIKYPENWNENELYNFNWSELKKESVRFNKINYNEL